MKLTLRRLLLLFTISAMLVYGSVSALINAQKQIPPLSTAGNNWMQIAAALNPVAGMLLRLE